MLYQLSYSRVDQFQTWKGFQGVSRHRGRRALPYPTVLRSPFPFPLRMTFNPFSDREIHAPRARLGGASGLMVGALVALALQTGTPAPVVAQDGDFSVLRAGELRFGVSGGFTWADRRYDEDGNTVLLSQVFDTSNGATLFPDFDRLQTNLAIVTGSGLGTPFLGPVEAFLQVDHVEVPVKVELGVLSWFTLGVTMPFVRSKVEGEVGLFPSGIATAGLNPSLVDYDRVLSFTRSLETAAAGLPADQAEVWGAWAQAWVEAYAASVLFPAAGTNAGNALVAAVEEFNAVLAAAGRPPVGTGVPLAEAVLDRDGVRELLGDPDGPYQYYPLSRPLLWGLGDMEIEGRLKIFEAGIREETGRPGYGLTLLGRVRLPTGEGPDPRAIYEIPRGDGQMDVEAGAATWLRGGRLGLGATVTYTVARSGTVLRRVAPLEVPIVPVVNIAEVEWTPGNQLAFEVRPSFAISDPLFLEARYRYRSKSEDTFELVGEPPVPGETIPYPEGFLGYDPSVLAVGTDLTFQTLGGGLRYHPPQGEFPVEAWFGVEYALSGSGSRTLKRTRAEFGGRVYWALWGN